ncbi:MAG: Type II secretion system protein E [Parcubacteria group bacterium GW2011_GWF1_52_5]|nr:MAG: Type II secretion system protein E [Parcubacteria group bacterium GW2011_GWF1_52_5]
MVGEIRDKETARLAIQAALTGHLVFSTLHTNNTVGVVPRLIDMGVDPYLIGPTLICAIAQRLVAKLCPEDKEPIPTEGGIKMMVEKDVADLPPDVREKFAVPQFVYRAKQSPSCPSGTKGRMAVFELFTMDADIEKIILTNPSDVEIYRAVRKKGMITMKEDAMLKAFQGMIPFEEVNKL